MAAIFHQTISTPFIPIPATHSYHLDEHFGVPIGVSALDPINPHTVIQERVQQRSPASFFSVAPARLIRNNENRSPCPTSMTGTAQRRAVSADTPKHFAKDGFQGQIRPRNFTHQPSMGGPALAEVEGDNDTAIGDQQLLGTDYGTRDRLDEEGLRRLLTASSVERPCTPVSSVRNTAQEKSTSDTIVKGLRDNYNALVTPESGLSSRVRVLRQQAASGDAARANISPTPSEYLVHQQRLSDGSSGFVHSMKTASMTNASFSVVPRSSRLRRSTDSHAQFGTQPRASVDSDRPTSSGSVDDAAVRRGFRRQQIIDEIVATEGSYVADLKALVYLYTTLLASASSIPNRIRSAIQRNVDEILHAHEKILERFHNAKLQAAARRWADTTMPGTLGHRRRLHARTSERADHSSRPRAYCQSKSIDSADVFAHHPQQPGSAEPIDVYEITAVFKEAIKSFYAYEEYCANYEMIGRELQKHMPGVWPAYESGMESLARLVVAIDQRGTNNRKGLTMGDLLIKPIQRMTKYPLLLEQLLNSTPVADAPGTHAELDLVLQNIRGIVQMINLAIDNHFVRLAIQRRSLLQERLDLSRLNTSAEQYRTLGTVELCGVLYIAYQSTVAIGGSYALCVLFDEHLLVALPMGNTGRFEAIAILQLCDIKIASPTDGKGLQCASTVFTWKVSFACAGHFHELMFSGCSQIEEKIWVAGMVGEFSNPVHHPLDVGMSIVTCLAFDLKSTGVVFPSQRSLSRDSSVHRAATVVGHTNISPIIVRNTHNVHDLPEYRDSATVIPTINRSQSHATAKRTPVLEPKRSERTRLENSISDIWTKERLPFPGMIGSRGGQIIRASAGLARKLSLASIHTTFSKSRTSSLSSASRKSHDLFNDAKSTFELRRRQPQDAQLARVKPKDIPEVDDMRSVVGRMIGGGVPSTKTDATSGGQSTIRDRDDAIQKSSTRGICPNDSAALLYEDSEKLASGNGLSIADDVGKAETPKAGELNVARTRGKRWSNPMSKLRGLGFEAMSILQPGSMKG